MAPARCFFICSRVFEEIVNRCGTDPTEENVRKWIEEIGNVLNLKLLYSPLLHRRLADKYKRYTSVMKVKTGGRGRARYRSQLWNVPVEDRDVHYVAVQQQVKELQEILAALERKLSSFGTYVAPLLFALIVFPV